MYNLEYAVTADAIPIDIFKSLSKFLEFINEIKKLSSLIIGLILYLTFKLEIYLKIKKKLYKNVINYEHIHYNHNI